MKRTGPAFTLKLMGSFRLSGAGGERIEIASRKGMALIAMLATSADGERARAWLQDRLWGSRQPKQAQDSLRRELHELRDLLNCGPAPLLGADRRRVWLDLDNLAVDVRGDIPMPPAGAHEFLEGLDIPGEDGFEDWLREERRIRAEWPASAPTPEPLPSRVVDVSQPAPGFKGQPALAVLPFANLTGDPGNDYLAEALGEDLIDRLSRLRWLPVIARTSSFATAATPLDHAAIGQRLGAKYLFEGRLRRAGDGYGLAVELSEAATRRVLWSDRIEAPQIFTPKVQAEIVAQLVGALDTRIDAAEQLRARTEPPRDAQVSDLIWKGRWHINRLTREDAEQARAAFARALEREPGSAEALIQSAWALGRSIWAERRSEAQVQEMRELAQRAIRADPDDSRGHWLAGVAEMWLRRPERAKTLLRRAIELNPSLAEAHSALGDTYLWNGEPELALQSLRASLRLNPTDLMVFTMLSAMATAYWMQGRFADAVDLAEQSVVRRPGYWYGHAVKIAALMDDGARAAGAQAWRDLMAAKPGFRLEALDWVPFIDCAWNARMKKLLEEAAALAAAPDG
jgi:Predicted integral membrane protein